MSFKDISILCSFGHFVQCSGTVYAQWLSSRYPLKKRYTLDKQVIDKGYFSEAFLFKPQGGHSPPSGLNRKPRKNPLFSL